METNKGCNPLDCFCSSNYELDEPVYPVTAKVISDGIKTAYNNGEYGIGLVKESMEVATISYQQQRNIFQVTNEMTSHLEEIQTQAIRLAAPELYRVMFQQIPVGQRPDDNILLNF